MAYQQEYWAEFASHPIETGNVPDESDNFMGSAEDGLALQEAFQIDPDLLNDGEPVPDDSEPALQHQAIEASPEIDDPEYIDPYDDTFDHELEEDDDAECCPEAESHVIIDAFLDESDDFLGTAEDELAMRGAIRNEAEAALNDAVPCEAPVPAKAERFWPGEGMFSKWHQFMYDMRDLLSVWDKRHPKFIRSELYDFIYRRIRDSLKSSIVEEKFGCVFVNGEWGENRMLRSIVHRLLDEFIDELCIQRLDLKRLTWEEIMKERKLFCASVVHPDLDYEKHGAGALGLTLIIPECLKSSQLVEKFKAEIKYDRQYDMLKVTCDTKLLDKAIEDIAAEMNRLKPFFLMEKKEKAKIEYERNKMEQAKATAANAAEIKELRKELEAERMARQKAEEEIERLLAEKKELEARLTEKREAAVAPKEAEKASPGDPLSREREIERIRHEWGDSDLAILDRILEMKKELAPLEAEHSLWANRSKSLEEAIDNEIRRYYEDKKRRYWSEAELAALPSYQDGKYPEPHPCLVDWRTLTREFRKKYQQELDEIKDKLREYAIKCENLRADISSEERTRALSKTKYKALLAPLGTSLDPAKIQPVSSLDDLAGTGCDQVADTVLHGLPLGKIGCLAGPGGLGKTQLMTQLGMDIACGRNGMKKGGVFYIYGEDAKPFMEQRRAAALSHASLAFSENELADIGANFVPWYLDGARVDLTDEKSEDAQNFRIIVRKAERDLRRKGTRLRLIVLDTLSVFNGGKETLSEHVYAILDAMQRLCLETGASLVFLHHATKEAGASGNSGAGSVRGHSSLTNGVRWVTILSAMTEKEARELSVDQEERSRYAKITLAKCNSVAPQKPEWFRMDEFGVFVPADFPDSVRIPEKPSPDLDAPLQTNEKPNSAPEPDSAQQNTEQLGSALKPGQSGASRIGIAFGGRNAQQR